MSLCLDAKLKGIKHTHFVKREQTTNVVVNKNIPYEPMNNNFSQINEKVEKNKEVIW